MDTMAGCELVQFTSSCHQVPCPTISVSICLPQDPHTSQTLGLVYLPMEKVTLKIFSQILVASDGASKMGSQSVKNHHTNPSLAKVKGQIWANDGKICKFTVRYLDVGKYTSLGKSSLGSPPTSASLSSK